MSLRTRIADGRVERQCYSCEKWLPEASCFYWTRGRFVGRCMICAAEASLAWYYAHRERALKREHDRYQARVHPPISAAIVAAAASSGVKL